VDELQFNKHLIAEECGAWFQAFKKMSDELTKNRMNLFFSREKITYYEQAV